MKIDRKPFSGDLTDGELWEYRAAKAVSRELGYLFQASDGREKDVIFYVPEDVEIKVDFMAEKTGNLYLEIRNTRQDVLSGLMTSKAKKWIHAVPHLNEAFIFDISTLVVYLSTNNQLQNFRQVEGGDENSRGILIPIEKMRSLPFIQVISLEMGK